MNITRHLYLSSALRAPDEPAAPEPEVVVEPVAEVVPEPVAEVVAEPEPAPAPEVKPAAPHGNSGKSPWYMRELAQTREEKRQANTQREAAEQRAADLQAIIDRLQADPNAPAPVRPAARAEPAPQDFNAAVRAQSAKDRLYEDTAVVRAAGEARFTDFGDTLGILHAIGATNDDFVADLLVAVPKESAPDMLDKLAKDPEKAASLVGMDPRRRIAELTRMADALKTPEAKAPEPAPKPAAQISRAPAPKPALSPLAAAPQVDPTTAEGNDKMSDAEWEAWYKGKYQKRA